MKKTSHDFLIVFLACLFLAFASWITAWQIPHLLHGGEDSHGGHAGILRALAIFLAVAASLGTLISGAFLPLIKRS